MDEKVEHGRGSDAPKYIQILIVWSMLWFIYDLGGRDIYPDLRARQGTHKFDSVPRSYCTNYSREGG